MSTFNDIGNKSLRLKTQFEKISSNKINIINNHNYIQNYFQQIHNQPNNNQEINTNQINHKSMYYNKALAIKEEDAKLATYYYEKAWSEEKYIPGIFALAKCYEEGNGVKKNIMKAETYRQIGRAEVQIRKNN